jgi:glutathione S-transferase
MSNPETVYELYYWPSIQGRGELIRLLLEDAGAPYRDVARLPPEQGGGVPAILRMLKEPPPGAPPFAPPILKAGDLVLAQVANICQFLGPRLGLVPGDEGSRAHALQLQLTIADLVAEVHDTHHPISSALYYEDQQEAARERAASFLAQRLPKFLGYFERAAAGSPYLLGSAHSYVDLSMFQVLEGLAYAFPRGFEGAAVTIPSLLALRQRVAERPGVAAYLASERRLPFNEDGIFRRYPELDAASS